ncbi:NUDIX domain-containing protein [Periweissella cryptocerci]|uniref:NUDIX domain-containing protein n=1 Tax=Periweissella cryptocerci TaxID=2506420 RepID=A0A4P6YR60_9LACO|nr:NUDIX domain-containing protein [Periweissella cryptocerci]QBO35104.1 NUDIX domain-containing protein [Periweissella cryptocerci]
MPEEPADKIGELWDIFDSAGNATGRTSTRGTLLPVGDFHRIVEAVIIDDYENILVQQRSFQKLVRPGEWTSETGGSVLAGETLLKAMHREVLEEIGLAVTVDLNNVFTTLTERKPTDARIASWFAIQTSAKALDLTLQASEVIAAEFVPLSDPRIDSRRQLVNMALAHLHEKTTSRTSRTSEIG